MSETGPESFYRPPASGLDAESAAGPGPAGRFYFSAAWSDAVSAARHQYLPGMALVIVYLALVFFSYMSCVGILLVLPHLTAGLTLAGLAMCRERSGLTFFFRGFQRYATVFGGALFLFCLGGLIQGAPIWLHLVLGEARQGFLDEVYMDSLSDMYSGPLLGALLLVCQAARVYFQARLLPLFPLIVERRLGLFAAIAAAWRFTAADQFSLFGLMAITSLLTYAGYFLLCAGFILLGPMVVLVEGAALRQLLGEREAREEQAEEPGTSDVAPDSDPYA